MKNKKIIMTGGGTSGHVTPNLALIPNLKSYGYEIMYIGSKDGIEKKIIENEKIKYFGISTGKLRRYIDLKNISDPFKVFKGIYDAFRIIKKEKPNVVFSKGGFVAVPVVLGAFLNKVPVISHESDITPGLANKISMNYIKKICVTFPETMKFNKNNKFVLTGSPMRKELFQGKSEEGKIISNFKNTKPSILVIGGSLGSVKINNEIRKNLDEILQNYNVIHVTGKNNLDEKLLNISGYKQFEYVTNELPHLLAYADMVISRAGANTIFELLALKKPNILIPLSKNASRGDQILNAKSFSDKGYSLLLEEENLNGKSLVKSINDLYKDKDKYVYIMSKSPLADSVEKIVTLINENAKF